MSENESVRIYRIPKWVGLRILATGLLIAALGSLVIGFAIENRGRPPAWVTLIVLSIGILELREGLRWIAEWWIRNKNSLVVTEEGIRNLDPARLNVIPWDEIVEIRPRLFLKRLEVLSSRPFKPIQISYRIEEFEDVASEIALRSENASKSVSDRFDTPHWPRMLIWFTYWPHFISITFVFELFHVWSGQTSYVLIGVLTFLSFFDRSRSVRCRRLSIRPVLLALSTSAGESNIALSDIEEIRLTTVLDNPGFRTLDVRVKTKDGANHPVSPRGVNPLDVFYSVHAAWEKYKQRGGTGESRSDTQSVSTDFQ